MTDKKDLAVTEGNKLIASKEERRLVETFMGYADGYLSKFIRWNDVMPVVEKVELNLPTGFTQLNGQTFEKGDFATSLYTFSINPSFTLDNSIRKTSANSKIEAVWQAVVEFIKLYNNKYTTCDKCEGEGLERMNDGGQYDCPNCDGSGKVENIQWYNNQTPTK